MKGYSKYFWIIHSLGDVFLLNIAFVLMYFLEFKDVDFSDKYRFLLIIFNITWILVAFFLSLYDLRFLNRLDKILFNLLKAFVFNALTISAFLFSLKSSEFSRSHLYFTYLLFFWFTFFWRYSAIHLLKLYRRSGYNFSRVVIVGAGEIATQLSFRFINDTVLGVKLLGVFFDKQVDNNVQVDSEFCFHLDNLEHFALENSVDEIYYTMSLDQTFKIKKLVEFCDRNMIRFKVVPDFRGFLFKRVNIDFFVDIPVITVREEPLTDFVNRILKRFFDICFSFFVIVFLLSWLYPIIAILIKLSSKGPVLFKQSRSGVNNVEFLCFKFRSMTVSSMANIKQATKGDTRITKVGKFLRKTSLDEFPQFFNVFIGEMSIVGPRPHMLKHTEEYSTWVNNFMVRQLVKPGITGVAQINGFRGEIKNIADMDGRVRNDVWYIENWSLALDISIIFHTVLNLVKGDKKAY